MCIKRFANRRVAIRGNPNRYDNIRKISDTSISHQLYTFVNRTLSFVMSLPSVEVLETHHDFPCQYTFKVIGSSKDNFLTRVVSAVRDELQLDVDPEYSMRSTRNGNHVAVTLEPHCESAQRVLAIYGRLTGMDGVVMLL